ncbi:hypothetical protein THAOC_23431, partial [Thalassiosira oceanica]
MPFKEEVFKHLPRKGDDSKQLSTVGSEWGDFFYSCLSRQASEYLTKEEEYDRSNEVLSEVLRMDETVSAVGEHCVAAMLILQDKLKRKERYLAHHMRLPIYMNFGGKTTSPCESMNRRAKHGDKSVNSTVVSVSTKAAEKEEAPRGYKTRQSISRIFCASRNRPT